jgi:hypothetical protein
MTPAPTAGAGQHQRPHRRQSLQQGAHKGQKIRVKRDVFILNPAAQLFRPTVGVHGARHPAGDFGQLATLARDDPADHKDQRFQVPSQIAPWLTRVQLLHGPLYGTILSTAVTHVCAPVLWRELEHSRSVSRHSKLSGSEL